MYTSFCRITPSINMRLYLFHVAFEKNESYEANKPRADQPPRTIIHLVCKTQAGGSRVLRVMDWMPWLYLKPTAEQAQYPLVWRRRLEKDLKACGCASVTIEQRIQFVGFTNDRVQPYARCRFRIWSPYLPAPDQKLYESVLEKSVKVVTKFMHESGLRSGAWFDVDTETNDVTTSQLHSRPEITASPPLTLCALDLETTGLDAKSCTINQCCLIFHDMANGPVAPDSRSLVICSQPTVSNKTRLCVVDGEKALIMKIGEILRATKPDIITGYNLPFDMGFLKERSLRYTGVTAGLSKVGRVGEAKFVEQTLSNSAMGTQTRVLWQIPGVFVLDLLLYCKINYSELPKRSLNYVADKFLGSSKLDCPFGVILESFSESGTPELRGEVAEYCEIDGYLCLRLMEKWSAHIACLEEAACCSVNVSTIIDTGRQSKIISLILSKILGSHVFNPPPSQEEDGVGDEDAPSEYQGATVIETQRGFYGGECQEIILLDFASLYPSVQIAYEISPDRYVRQHEPAEVAAAAEEGVVITSFQISPDRAVQLAKPPSSGKPIFSEILITLLRERAAVRKLIPLTNDVGEKAILDCRQVSDLPCTLLEQPLCKL